MLPRIASELRHRLRALLRRGAVEHELDEELRFHLERETERHEAAGLPRAEAVRRARLAFGGLERIKDDARDQRGLVLLDQLAQDTRFAARSLAARPAFACGVVVTLALGIGVNATMFGIVDRLLFRAPPGLRAPDAVHRVYAHWIADGEPRTEHNLSFATWLDLRATTRSFDALAAFQTRQLAVGDGESARERRVTVATATYFDFFDTRPALGRFFTAAEDSVPNGAPVVVLGWAFWQAQYAGRDVIGERLRVDSTECTIIGVAPRSFTGMADQGVPAAYVPITMYAAARRGPGYPALYGWSWLEIIVRRAPGVRRAAAEQDLTAALIQSRRNAAARNPGWGDPDSARLRGTLRPVQLGRGPQAPAEARLSLWVGGVALIVLLIACANVANLLLSRAVSRRREIAMRVALGAGRMRLVRQLLTESVMLALLGGFAGLLVARWGATGLRRWFFPADLDAGVFSDGRTLLVAAVATCGAALLTGLLPALQAGRCDVTTALKSGGREGSAERSRTRTVLLVLQPALSVVLLVGAGLFVRSLLHVEGFRLGYDVEPVMLAEVNTRGVRMDSAGVRALNARLLAAAAEVPGVTSVTLAASVPFWSNESRHLAVPGVDSLRSRGRFLLQAGGPDYFRTMGTRILRGRGFDVSDRAGAPLVAVVSEGMARVVWPGRDALGQCMHIGSDSVPCATVVGIAENVRVRTLTDEREFTYYVPAGQYDDVIGPTLLVRVAGRAADQVEAVRRRLQRELPGAAYVTAAPFRDLVDPAMRSWRFGAVLFAAFGALALLMAAVGLYSVIAFDVAQRTRDLGVRIALGASRARLMRWVLARGARPVAAGIVLGGLVALWAAPTLESLLFRQPARDPAVFLAVTAALLLVGMVASAAPAIRAARVDPNVALRAD